MSMSDVIVLLMPVLVFAALWLFQWFEQRLPPAKRQELDYYAEKAVKYVEQKYEDKNSNYKKSQAVTLIYAFFKEIDRPAPSKILVDAAIEVCVYEIQQMKIPALKMVDTGPIKAVPPPPEGGQPA